MFVVTPFSGTAIILVWLISVVALVRMILEKQETEPPDIEAGAVVAAFPQERR
jgi:hypothetical protein